jgi:hypothetical protein
MLDISAHVMMGWDWTGEPVYRRAGVLCFAQEGGESIAGRLAAITKHKIKSDKRLPFAWANSCPKLLDKVDPLPVLVSTAKAAHERFMKEHKLPLGLIWIETMSTASGWTDESDSAEAAQVLNTLRELSKQTGAVVAGVDHLGKNIDAGARGSSTKEGNADFVLALLGQKDLSGQISNMRLALRKIREGPAGLEFPVAPRTVDMGKDDHNLPVTSIVLDWSVTPSPKYKDTRTHAEHQLEHAVSLALMQHGETIKLSDGHEVRGVDEKHARSIFKTLYRNGANARVKQQAFRRALKGGWVQRQMVAGNEYLWL